MITYWILFIILFGVVVFIHELGHFSVAKLSGVFVERFALGFGPAIFKKKWGETEYAICALPLGGYVKMRGEDPEEAKNLGEDPRAFSQTPVLRRIAIVCMGPLSNLILPIFLFTGLFIAGMPTLISQVGSILPGSPAEKGGVKPGDLIIRVNDTSIWKWSELEENLQHRPGQNVTLSIVRSGQPMMLTVVPAKENDTNVFGDVIAVGKIGVSPSAFLPVVGISSPHSIAAQAGMRTGDQITSINGNKVSYLWQVEELLNKSQGEIHMALMREKKNVDVTLPSGSASLASIGAEDGELYIREVRDDSVAKAKGIQVGDRLVALNGSTLTSWIAFQQKVRENAGEKISLTVRRAGVNQTIEFIPQEVVDKNQITQEREKKRQFGVVSASIPADLSEKDETYRNPFVALWHGTKTTWDMIALTVKGLGKLFTGQMALKKSLGGPISIFYLAGGSYETGGWTSFFRMMALLSITLGVINFIPVPVLDGGHLLFFVIEWLRGHPVSLRVREKAQQVGMVLIIGLMLLTFYVDIERYFLDRIRSLFN